jgi:hypothetical protein
VIYERKEKKREKGRGGTGPSHGFLGGFPCGSLPYFESPLKEEKKVRKIVGGKSYFFGVVNKLYISLKILNFVLSGPSGPRVSRVSRGPRGLRFLRFLELFRTFLSFFWIIYGYFLCKN